MLQLRRLLREQLLEALVAPMRRSRRRGRCGIAPTDGARRADDLAARQGPPVPPDHCTAEGRILVSSPRHCLSHGWTTRVRVEHGGSPAASATPVGDAATVFLAGVLAGPLCFTHALAGDAAVHPNAPGAARLRSPAH